MLKTPLCDLLGIEKPVFQGGMAWIADASLASAVSEAGGLGIIAAMNADANWLRDQIHELRARTDKPFGVNVMLMSPFADEVARVVIDERVPVVVTGAGNPTKYMKAWNEAGIKAIPVVASVALARLVARRGATAVVAEVPNQAAILARPRRWHWCRRLSMRSIFPWLRLAVSLMAAAWRPPLCWAPPACRWVRAF